ncbi:kinase domain, nitrogen network kinase 1, phloem protein 2-like protein, partial [Tanacetum coccineum]
FGEVLEITAGHEFEIEGEIKQGVTTSRGTKYAVYLVYKLPQDQSTVEAPMFVWHKDEKDKHNCFVYLVSPSHTPVIEQKFDKNSCRLPKRQKLSSLPRQRSDGWMEVSPSHTPVIGQKLGENSYNPLNIRKLNALPRQRSDGWMEVKLWGFETWSIPTSDLMHFKLKHPGKKNLSGLIIYGIELRPE